MHEDMDLLTFLLIAGRGRCKYVIKASEIEGVIDNWLYSMSGISREQRDLGGLTKRQKEKLADAANFLNRVAPMFVEEPEAGGDSPYQIDLNF